MNLETIASGIPNKTVPRKAGHVQRLSICVKNARFVLTREQMAPPELYQARKLWMRHQQGDKRALSLCIDLIEGLLQISWDSSTIPEFQSLLVKGQQDEIPATSIDVSSVHFGPGLMLTVTFSADFEVRFNRQMTSKRFDRWVREHDDNLSFCVVLGLDGPDGELIPASDDEGIHVELTSDQDGPGKGIGASKDRAG